jgi:hypothetical protein
MDLNDLKEVDHVIVVDFDGSVTDAPDGIYAPTLAEEHVWGDPHGPRWQLMGGYTGQYGYRGPIMHPSEFIGGRLARDIMAQPGYYAAVTSHSCTDGCESECLSEPDGWAVVYAPIP